ncbi:DUF1254 domain-containing protein [bacterium]|nr:DUF1254 domain-containing protein [bacterium]MDB4540162.1 DUF1254 domain-containing protein [bacterium]
MKDFAILFAALTCLVEGSSALGQATPGYNTAIPPQIMTPDEVETEQLGTLKFFDGLPDEVTVDKIYDNLDRMRGVQAFLDLVPVASVEGLRRGMEELGIDQSNKILLYEGLMDSNSLFLTGNTDTIYAIGMLDLQRDGPTVVEIPPGAGPGTVNDAYFRFVIDMGGPGPDKGKGGKYLILPPGYDGEIPEGYFAVESPSYANWLPLRGFLKDGKTDAAVKMWKEGLKIYPLAKADNPPELEVVNGTGKQMNTIHANDFSFYSEINDVIQREPVEFIDSELRGNLASIGIEKGKKFAPDARMTRILTEAVAIANATARTLAFRPRSETIRYYGPKSAWFSAFDGGDYRWLSEDGKGGRNKDARTLFFYIATVNTPAMVLEMIGVGSQYALAATDLKGRYLEGSENYKLNIPADVPAKDFWSLVVYDPQTRSMLQTDQPYPSKNNERNLDLKTNPDGSTTIWFGPKAPAGNESNWIQTVAGKGWFLCLRLYGPLEPWFNKTWRPGEIEKL